MAHDEERRGPGMFWPGSHHPPKEDIHLVLQRLHEMNEKFDIALGRLERIETSAGHTEASVGASQGALERLEKTMPVKQEVQDALDALEGKVGARVTTEVQQVKDAIAAAVSTAQATIDELNAKVDQLVAEGNSSDTVTAIQSLGDRLDTEIDSIAPGSPAPVPEPEPPTP